MRHYLKYSLLLHSIVLGALLLITSFWKGSPQNNLRFTILPKGTSLGSVLTSELAQKALPPTPQLADHPAEVTATPPIATSPPASRSPAAPPPEAILSPSPTPDSAAPQPTPTPTVTPLAATPSPTPTLTPVPEKTVIVTPKRPSATVSPRASEAPKAPSSSAKARSTQRTAQVSPTARVNSTRASSAKAPIAAAREDLPRQLPRGVTPRPAAVHEEVGVPGVAEGVEGAPLPLDRSQSLLSAVYATRARMRIQSNFNVPPDVNDPSITCVVEWEITPDGTIRNIRVVKSTGIARLDACAVEALRKTGNLGPLPPEWGNRSVWTSLTFMFAGDFPSPAITDSVPASANPRTSSP